MKNIDRMATNPLAKTDTTRLELALKVAKDALRKVRLGHPCDSPGTIAGDALSRIARL